MQIMLRIYKMIGLTFELHVLHRAFRQRVEGVPREVGRGVKHVGLPLLQDVLQQLIQDVPCRDEKVRGYHTSPGSIFTPAKRGELVVASTTESGSPFLLFFSLLSRHRRA